MHLDELNELATEIREAKASCKCNVRVCMAAGCQSSGAGDVLEGIKEKVSDSADVQVKGVGCMGLCSAGPLVEVESVASDERVM